MNVAPITTPGFTMSGDHHHHHNHEQNALSGFWLFMMGDLIIFGLMFATYVTMLVPMSFAGGPTPKDLFELPIAALETEVLLVSTFTFGMASVALSRGRSQRAVMAWLGLTLLLGLSFLGLELHEFANLIGEGATPQRSGYLSGFYGLVPLHGFHVAVGIVWLILMMFQLYYQGITASLRSRLVKLALFWHFLDLIWIGIFSVVYLGGLA